MARPSSWPEPLLRYLNAQHELFLDWEAGPKRFGASAYDRAIYSLSNVLQPYSLRGWHCTRLTDTEAKEIERDGMKLPDVEMLRRRIDVLVVSGCLEKTVAGRFIAENQAHEKNRAGMIWFCFFPPRLAGESGIGRFFRSWGGEALYNSHENNPTTVPILGAIGVPCLVEAIVPISSLAAHGGLEFGVVRRFLIARGGIKGKRTPYAGRTTLPLSSGNIRRIIRFPDPAFMALTGCARWQKALSDVDVASKRATS